MSSVQNLGISRDTQDKPGNSSITQEFLLHSRNIFEERSIDILEIAPLTPRISYLHTGHVFDQQQPDTHRHSLQSYSKSLVAYRAHIRRAINRHNCNRCTYTQNFLVHTRHVFEQRPTYCILGMCLPSTQHGILGVSKKILSGSCPV